MMPDNKPTIAIIGGTGDLGSGLARLRFPVLVTRTLMQSLADRERLAKKVVAFAERLATHRPRDMKARAAGGISP